MAGSRRSQGPTGINEITQQFQDGTLCRQKSPLPTALQENIDNAIAKRLGTPYSIDSTGTVKSALLYYKSKVMNELVNAQTEAEVICITMEWEAFKLQLGKVLDRPLIRPKEESGDEAVFEVVKDVIPGNEIKNTLMDIVKVAFLDEKVKIEAVVIKGIVNASFDWITDILYEGIKEHLVLMIGLVRSGANESQRRKKLRKMDSARLAIELTKKSTILSKILSKELQKHGIKINERKLLNIARRIIKKVLSPSKLLPGILGKIAKKISLTGLKLAYTFVKIILTPSSTSKYSDDIIDPIVRQIDQAVLRAYSRYAPQFSIVDQLAPSLEEKVLLKPLR